VTERVSRVVRTSNCLRREGRHLNNTIVRRHKKRQAYASSLGTNRASLNFDTSAVSNIANRRRIVLGCCKYCITAASAQLPFLCCIPPSISSLSATRGPPYSPVRTLPKYTTSGLWTYTPPRRYANQDHSSGLLPADTQVSRHPRQAEHVTL
jgi:hypothetical protein